ncbi:SDR family NAD(P)-dependent oxidoreductase [Celeribacter persicus]|nr:SDR family NAD(P)-dependent oxidoreductase [Celeribacter persicus]
MTCEFGGKTVLVTGGAAGIGLALARAFEAQGAETYIADIDAEALQAAPLATERKILMDVRNKESVSAGFAGIGVLDILVCSAAVSSMGGVLEITETDWDAAIDTNLRGVWLTNAEAMKRFAAQGHGCVLNISAMAGKIGPPLFGAYAASKAGVIGWTQSLAREVAPMGVRANVICPGFTETGMQVREIGWDMARRGVSADHIREEYVAMTPMGRLESVEDVVPVALFLCSDGAGFMTGQAVNTTGGVCLV